MPDFLNIKWFDKLTSTDQFDKLTEPVELVCRSELVEMHRQPTRYIRFMVKSS